jgi:YD repeat-containing protein
LTDLKSRDAVDARLKTVGGFVALQLWRVADRQDRHQPAGTLTYNPAGTAKAGTIATAQDGNLNTTTYNYDSLGQLTSVVPQPLTPAGTGTQLGNTAYTYDGLLREATIEGSAHQHLSRL